jgi:hypothetical protein
MKQPFAATELSPKLQRVEAHWRSLIRGANDMPFWDDFVPSALADIAADALLLDVFAKPLRFRFNSIVGWRFAIDSATRSSLRLPSTT